MSIARVVWLLPLLALLACGGTQLEPTTGDPSAQPVNGALAACDPFGAEPSPIALGTVVAVGKDAAGVIYVVDHVGPEQRVFVSDAGGNLVRQRVVGSGTEHGDTFDRYVLDVTDHEPAFVLQIDIPLGSPLRMGVVIGALKDSKTFVIGQQGEELTVLPSDAIAGMPIQNLPGTVVLEYAAILTTGALLVATRPSDDWDYTDFRVFVGGADAVSERHVDNVTRSKDGGSTHIVFDLDGQTADAFFPIVYADGGFAHGQATLGVAGGESPLVWLDVAPTGAVYLCLP